MCCCMGRLCPSNGQGVILFYDREGIARVEKGSTVKLADELEMILPNTNENGHELIADDHLILATMVGEMTGNKILD
ncbi:hypothetical protein PTKIN_Ptkin07bG0087000 [Pterospermum kingtungense]